MNILIIGLTYSPDLGAAEIEFVENLEIQRRAWLAAQGIVEVGEPESPEPSEKTTEEKLKKRQEPQEPWKHGELNEILHRGSNSYN